MCSSIVSKTRKPSLMIEAIQETVVQEAEDFCPTSSGHHFLKYTPTMDTITEPKQSLISHQRVVPVHQADGKQVIKKLRLEFGVSQIVVVVLEIIEIEILVRCSCDPLQ